MNAKFAISNGNQMIYKLPSGKAIKTRMDAEEALFWANFDSPQWKIVDIVDYSTTVLKRYCTASNHWVQVQDDLEIEEALKALV